MENVIIEMEKILNEHGKLKLSEFSSEQIEQAKDYIGKLDLSKLVFNDKKSPRFKNIVNPIEMVHFLLSKKKINGLTDKYVSHYTSYDIAKKIISSRKIHLSNPASMNDGLEFSSPKMDCSKIYFASFSIERSENIGMWSMYGQPWENGIKISIPKKIFSSWVGNIKSVYHIDPKTHETITSDFLGENDFKPSISRVAYVEWNDNQEILSIRCGNTINKKLKDIDVPILSGFIKDSAWSYENEIRLRVDLNFKISDTSVAIDIPDEIIKSIVITTGPRFNKSIIKEELAGIALINKSSFTNKLRSIYCDKCSRHF